MSKHNHNHQHEEPETITEQTVETQETETSTAQEELSELDLLKQNLQAAQDKVAELEDLKLRQMAEFDNYRRRTQKEKLELMDSAGEGIFRDMLPLMDDFERAMQHLRTLTADTDNAENNAMLEGVELIYQKFLTFLEQHKVTPIQTEGQPFSTDLHEAITTFAAGEDKKGQIIDCTQKGYKLGDKVIRFAKVVVGE